MTHPTGLGEYTDLELQTELADRTKRTEPKTPNIYLGTKSLTVAGEHYTDRLRSVIQDECDYRKMPMLSDEQIGVVVYSMRMHTEVMAMLDYDRSNLHNPNEIDPYWPEAASIGRFMSDAGEAFMEGEK